VEVRHHVWGWFFKLPWVRQFDGFCLTPWDIVLRPGFENDRSLIAHEYNHCYWWRIHKLTFPLSYVLYGYKRNPFEYLADHGIPHSSVLFRLYGAPSNKGITTFPIRAFPKMTREHLEELGSHPDAR
jgi:hypothetical protein